MSLIRPDERSPYFGSPGRGPVELEWYLTWPEQAIEHDFVAVDRGVTIGRVHLSPGARGADPWQWACMWSEASKSLLDKFREGARVGNR